MSTNNGYNHAEMASRNGRFELSYPTADLHAENDQLHCLLELRNAEIAFLRGQVDERDATLRSLRAPVYDILGAISSHLGNTTDMASKAKAEDRDLLMEECEESIEANNGDAELAAAEKWATETTKSVRKVPAPENRCKGICSSGTQCSRSSSPESSFCKTHLKMNTKASNTSSPDSEGDEKKANAATKAAKLVEREAVKATKAAAKLAERAATQATKLAEKEAKAAAKLAEREAKAAAKLAEKEAKAAAKLAEKEAKAAEREAAKALKPKRPTPPFALWQSHAKEEIAAQVAADQTGRHYLTIVGGLWKALPFAERERFQEMTKAQRADNNAAAALIGLSS